jgi:hypothetical protein
VASLPVADPLGRNVDKRLARFEWWPVRRQSPDAIGQDADENVFGWEGAASVVARPAQITCSYAHVHLRLQSSEGSSSYPSSYSRCPGGLCNCVRRRWLRSWL